MAVLPVEVKESGINSVTAKVKKLDKEWINLNDGTKVFLDRMGRVREANGQFAKDTTRVNEALGKTSKSFNTATTGANNFSAGLKTIATGAVAYIAIDRLVTSTINLGKAFVQTADEMSMVDSRLRLATNGVEDYTKAQQELFKISQDSRVEFKNTVDLYSQMSRSTESLNISQSRLLTVTDSISRALIISGGSAESANAALIQLGQGFASGTLRGEELNSVMEQTPRLAQAIAEGMGVSIGQLRAMGAEGLITAETVIKSLENQSEALKKEFESVAVTIDSGLTVISNALDMNIKKTNEFFGVTETVGTAFTALSEVADLMFDNFISGFSDSSEATEIFAEFVVGAVGGFIGAMGAITDIFNGIGLVVDAVQLGIYAVLSPIQVLANMVNSFLNGILSAVDALGKLAGFGGIDFRLNLTEFATDGIKTNLSEVSENFNQIGQGSDIAEKANLEMSTKFAELRLAQKEANAERDARKSQVQTPTTKFPTTSDYQSNYEQQVNETSSVLDAIANFGDSFSDIDLSNIAGEYSDNQAIQNEISKLLQDRYSSSGTSDSNNTKTIEDEIKAQEDLNEATQETSDALDDFKDSFYNDKDSFYQTVEDATSVTDDFTDSLSDLDSGIATVIDTMDDFIFQFTNTLFNSLQSNSSQLASLGQQTAFTSISYSQALEQAISAKDSLIANPLSATIGELYSNAYSQFVSSASDYLDASNFSSIEEFRFAQSTVGTQSNQFTTVASQGANVMDSMNELLGSINESLADGVLTDEESIKLRTLASDVNAKNDILLGNSGVKGATNTVASYISSLRGGKSSGIAISDIYSSVPELQVSTGLENPISTLTSRTNSVAGNTSSINSGVSTSNTKLASIDAKSGKIKSVSTRGGWVDSQGFYTNDTFKQIAYLETQRYNYYAKGGFTDGMGQRDHTGFKQAGIVHEGEYVAPKWMVDSNPMLFNQMEIARQKGSFADGGYTSQPSFNVSATMSNNSDLVEMRKDIKQMAFILNNITEGGNLMNVALRN